MHKIITSYRFTLKKCLLYSDEGKKHIKCMVNTHLNHYRYPIYMNKSCYNSLIKFPNVFIGQGQRNNVESCQPNTHIAPVNIQLIKW